MSLIPEKPFYFSLQQSKKQRGIIAINYFFSFILQIANHDVSSHSTIPAITQSIPIIAKDAAQKLLVQRALKQQMLYRVLPLFAQVKDFVM